MSKKPRRKLTREEKELIKEVMARSKKSGKQPATAQATIPYDRFWPDGICLANGSVYTKTLQYQDINYQLDVTRSHTNTIPQGTKLCGRLDHVVLKMGASGDLRKQ